MASLRSIGRLEKAHAQAVADDAIQEELRAVVFALLRGADAGAEGANFRGIPFAMSYGGQTRMVRLQDPYGQVDLYHAAPMVLEGIGLDPAARQRMLESLPAGQRYPTLAGSLAQMGVVGDFALQIMPMVTQRASNAQFSVENPAPGLEDLPKRLSGLEQRIGSVERVSVD
ncbi:hypothetical protein [Neogemmobacter tilapiae]|nr:hypothetical protein [Gemmobacter tilapiae]